jgi:hypothetical protein
LVVGGGGVVITGGGVVAGLDENKKINGIKRSNKSGMMQMQ